MLWLALSSLCNSIIFLTCWKVYHGVTFLSNAFPLSIDIIILLGLIVDMDYFDCFSLFLFHLFFQFNISCIFLLPLPFSPLIVTDFLMLSHSCIPRINPVWPQHVILLCIFGLMLLLFCKGLLHPCSWAPLVCNFLLSYCLCFGIHFILAEIWKFAFFKELVHFFEIIELMSMKSFRIFPSYHLVPAGSVVLSQYWSVMSLTSLFLSVLPGVYQFYLKELAFKNFINFIGGDPG